MRSALAGFPLLFAAVTPAHAAAGGASYPAAQVLGEFARACAHLEGMAAAEVNVVASGWTQVDPAPGTQLRRLIDMGKDMADLEEAPTRAFHKSVAGRELDLVLSEAGDSDVGITGRGCRVYDFAATAPITEREAKAWAGRTPTRSAGKSVIESMVWEPGVPIGHAATQIAFFPQGSAAGAALNLSGIGLMTQIFRGGAAAQDAPDTSRESGSE